MLLYAGVINSAVAGAIKQGEHLMMTVIRAFSAAALMSLSAITQAGVWGEEHWGQMYWGDNPVTTPSAPTILSIAADGTDLIVRIADYQPGGDGWSVVTNYTVHVVRLQVRRHQAGQSALQVSPATPSIVALLQQRTRAVTASGPYNLQPQKQSFRD